MPALDRGDPRSSCESGNLNPAPHAFKTDSLRVQRRVIVASATPAFARSHAVSDGEQTAVESGLSSVKAERLSTSIPTGATSQNAISASVGQ